MASTVIEELLASDDVVAHELGNALLKWQDEKASSGLSRSLGYEPRDIRQNGPVAVIEARVANRASGFDDIDPSESYEAIVDRHPERFREEIVAAARRRLQASRDASPRNSEQPPSAQLSIAQLANLLNGRSQTHPIGKLQNLRAELKGKRRAGNSIFTPKTIHPNWAFHYGGRTELQFNIGVEDGYIRHGAAFSFELSQTLRNIDVLVPKVRLFNECIQLYPDQYSDMRMWHYQDERRSSDYPPGPVSPELVMPGTFVFLGKRQPVDAVDPEAILNDFDRLLLVYRYVEGDGRERSIIALGESGFNFRAGVMAKVPAATASLAARELDINLKHNLLQAELCRQLISEFGAENVSSEQPSGLGTMIDVVLRRASGEYWYYEIKTALSPRSCIREALGQLLEYAYWPGANEASRLIICGESPLDPEGQTYVSKIRRRFRLPISYEQVVLPHAST